MFGHTKSEVWPEHATLSGSSGPVGAVFAARVLVGVGRSRLGCGHQSGGVRLPVTIALLRDIRRELERSAHPKRLVLWAVCCTAIFGFFRLGELLLTRQSKFDSRLHLSWGDMAVNDPQASSSTSGSQRQTSLAKVQISFSAGQGVTSVVLSYRETDQWSDTMNSRTPLQRKREGYV
jgi:hypothetical protein